MHNLFRGLGLHFWDPEPSFDTHIGIYRHNMGHIVYASIRHFWHFLPINLFKSCLMALVCIPEVLTHLLTPILPYFWMTSVGWHMRQIWHFWHFDINDAFINRHLLCLHMAIWVSNDASEPQERRLMPLNNFWIRLMAKNVKILTN